MKSQVWVILSIHIIEIENLCLCADMRKNGTFYRPGKRKQQHTQLRHCAHIHDIGELAKLFLR